MYMCIIQKFYRIYTAKFASSSQVTPRETCVQVLMFALLVVSTLVEPIYMEQMNQILLLFEPCPHIRMQITARWSIRTRQE